MNDPLELINNYILLGYQLEFKPSSTYQNLKINLSKEDSGVKIKMTSYLKYDHMNEERLKAHLVQMSEKLDLLIEYSKRI